MSVIKVRGIKSAAALAGMISARVPPEISRKTVLESTRSERTRSKNPEELTIKQHVFPTRSIQRFCNTRGCVSVYDIIREKKREAKPKDIIFCSDRGWSHEIERDMIKIESAFQVLCEKIIHNETYDFTSEDKKCADSMHALWFMRAQFRYLDRQEYLLNGVDGEVLTKQEEERLEKEGFYFIRAGGGVPSRFVNGVQLMLHVGKLLKQYTTEIEKWSVIKSIDGNFVIPDVPFCKIIPITPNISIVANHERGIITKENLDEINKSVIMRSVSYFFSKSLFDGKKDREIHSILLSLKGHDDKL